MKFYWDPKEQATKQHPVNIRFPKKLVQHTAEVRRVRIEIKHRSVPVFYRGNKSCVLVLVCTRDLIHHPNSYFIASIIHGYRCFIS